MVHMGKGVVELEVRMCEGASAEEDLDDNRGTHFEWIRRYVSQWSVCRGFIGWFDLRFVWLC